MDFFYLFVRVLYRSGPVGIVVITLIGALSNHGEPQTAEDYIKEAQHKQQSLENFQLALKDYNQAIKLDPKNAEAYAERGNFHLKWSKYLEKARTNKYTKKTALRFNFDLSKSDEMKQAALQDYRKAKALYEEEGEGYYALQLRRVIIHVQQGEDYFFRSSGPGEINSFFYFTTNISTSILR